MLCGIACYECAKGFLRINFFCLTSSNLGWQVYFRRQGLKICIWIEAALFNILKSKMCMCMSVCVCVCVCSRSPKICTVVISYEVAKRCAWDSIIEGAPLYRICTFTL